MSTDHRELAHAKLTCSLHIVGRREDGLHLLESEMVSLDLADELQIVDGDGLEVEDQITWTGSGDRPILEIPLGLENLVGRALALLGRTAAVRLTKRIPAGAGLGGGSADAAAMFRWAGVHDHVLAASLGSDIPFCISGGRAAVSGAGEKINPLQYEERSFVLLTPPLAVSTGLVYQAFDELERPPGFTAQNDLEHAALVVEPELRWWRDLFREVAGADPVLAGSGSTWFVGVDPIDEESISSLLREAIGAANRRACVTACQTVPALSTAED